jgi:hypothetical protein
MTVPAEAKTHRKRRQSGKIHCVTHGHPSLKDYLPMFLALDYWSSTGLGYAANGYTGGGRCIAVTRNV